MFDPEIIAQHVNIVSIIDKINLIRNKNLQPIKFRAITVSNSSIAERIGTYTYDASFSIVLSALKAWQIRCT